MNTSICTNRNFDASLQVECSKQNCNRSLRHVPQELWPWHDFLTCRPLFCTQQRFFEARQSITTWRYLSQPLRACNCNDPLNSKTFHHTRFSIAAYDNANRIRIYRIQLVFPRENNPIHIQENLLKPEMPTHERDANVQL